MYFNLFDQNIFLENTIFSIKTDSDLWSIPFLSPKFAIHKKETFNYFSRMDFSNNYNLFIRTNLKIDVNSCYSSTDIIK